MVCGIVASVQFKKLPPPNIYESMLPYAGEFLSSAPTSIMMPFDGTFGDFGPYGTSQVSSAEMNYLNTTIPAGHIEATFTATDFTG